MSEDRVIITENAKLLHSYKQFSRLPLPKSLKLKKMRDLFPAVHRMQHQRFRTIKEMISAVERKYVEICESYMNLTEAEASKLQDNFDTLIDRTPMHLKQHSQRQHSRALQLSQVEPERLVQQANDTTQSSLGNCSASTDFSTTDSVYRLDELRGREDSSSSDNSSHQARDFFTQENSQSSALQGDVAVSSQSTAQPSSQSITMPSQDPTAGALAMSSQEPTVEALELEASSQSVNVSVAPIVEALVPTFESLSDEVGLVEITVPSSSLSGNSLEVSDSSSRTSNRKRHAFHINSDVDDSSPATSNRRQPVIQPDDQQPGPSGVKQTRCRLGNGELVTNPTPEDFQRNPGMRQPRLEGG